MSRVMRCALLVVVSLCALSITRDACAQHFGRNKVEYVDFDFKVLETEHFAVYHYPSEEVAARLAARLAERWYARLSRVLGHTLRTRQPLILYGSQPEFAQTNVVGGFLGEGIGGVTESTRRRIVMPFAPTLAETDRILGHEIVHAFQFDMAGRYRGGLTWPLWAVEGMAQYLSLGAADAETAMWLRDAVASDLLPRRQHEAARELSPYRYGHALWAYLAGRFGDQVLGDVLKGRLRVRCTADREGHCVHSISFLRSGGGVHERYVRIPLWRISLRSARRDPEDRPRHLSVAQPDGRKTISSRGVSRSLECSSWTRHRRDQPKSWRPRPMDSFEASTLRRRDPEPLRRSLRLAQSSAAADLVSRHDAPGASGR